MQSTSKKRVTTLLDHFLQNAHLDASRILRLYTWVLIVIPLLFGMLLILNAGFSHQSVQALINKGAVTSVAVIIAILDFVLGYYLWLVRKSVLTDRRSYRFFMLCQVVSQLLVGNLLCGLLALLGLFQAKQRKLVSAPNLATRVVQIFASMMLIIFIICSIALILLITRK